MSWAMPVAAEREAFSAFFGSSAIDQTLNCRRSLERVNDQSGNGALQRCSQQGPSTGISFTALSDGRRENT